MGFNGLGTYLWVHTKYVSVKKNVRTYNNKNGITKYLNFHAPYTTLIQHLHESNYLKQENFT